MVKGTSWLGQVQVQPFFFFFKVNRISAKTVPYFSNLVLSNFYRMQLNTASYISINEIVIFGIWS